MEKSLPLAKRTASLARIPTLGALLVLAGCAASSSEYIQESRGYRISLGKVVKVENLHTESFQFLDDGVALKVSQPGCRVTMKIDRDIHVFQLGAGSQIVLGEELEAVLEAHRAGEGN